MYTFVYVCQQQLGKNIRFGQPPLTGTPVKKMQDLGAGIEKMEETYVSPMEASGERDMGLITDGHKVRLAHVNLRRWEEKW